MCMCVCLCYVLHTLCIILTHGWSGRPQGWLLVSGGSLLALQRCMSPSEQDHSVGGNCHMGRLLGAPVQLAQVCVLAVGVTPCTQLHASFTRGRQRCGLVTYCFRCGCLCGSHVTGGSVPLQGRRQMPPFDMVAAATAGTALPAAQGLCEWRR
jgi:hypothetical protein